jgi:histidinol-phosphate aminotransferase
MSVPAPRPELASLSPFQQGKGELADCAHPIKLSANESHLGPSPRAIEAYRRTADALYCYPDGSQLALRRAIAETFNLDAARIVCGNGSDELLQLLIRAFVLTGDEVVFSRFSFAMAMVHATAQGAKLVIADEPQMRPDTDALLRAVTAKTRMVFIASPNNPVGLYLPKPELWRLYRNLPPNILLINDGAYADYVIADDFESGRALVDAGNNAVMTRTFSKLYGLAGLRIGWAYAPPNVIDAIQRIRTPFNASTDAMAAAAAAVRDTEYAAHVRDYTAREMTRIRSTLNGTLKGIECLPSFTNFYLLRFTDLRHTPAGAAGALEAASVIPRPVQGSKPDGYLRITVGLAHENDIVLEVLTRYMQS